jgi:hypothetical protein
VPLSWRINPVAGANISTVRPSVTPDGLLGGVTAVANCWRGGRGHGRLFRGWHRSRQCWVAPHHGSWGLLPLVGFIWLLLSPVRQLRTLDARESQYEVADW